MSTQLVDRGWNNIKKELQRMQKMELVVGVLDSEVATYGAYNEFGTTHIPPRPFIRGTMENEGKDIAKLVKAVKNAVLSGGSAYNEVTRMGLHVQGLIQKTIRSGVGPGNAPSTIRQKGHARTLVGGKVNGEAGGTLMDIINYEIR